MEINEIEKKIVELKLRERELLEKRTRSRVKLLFNAESLPVVNNIVEDFFINLMGIDKRSIRKDSHGVKSEGRNNEEFLSQINVIISSDKMTDRCAGCRELFVSVIVDSGFEDSSVRQDEHNLMDEIESLRNSIDELLTLKRSIKKI
jgi:chorismate mutase